LKRPFIVSDITVQTLGHIHELEDVFKRCEPFIPMITSLKDISLPESEIADLTIFTNP
jgi:hypothetical protein